MERLILANFLREKLETKKREKRPKTVGHMLSRNKASQVVYLSSTSRALNPSPHHCHFLRSQEFCLLEGYPTIPRKKEELVRHTRSWPEDTTSFST